MAAAYHPAGRKRWLAARGGHARGETARAGAAEQHDGQAPATAAAATQLNFTADLSQPGGAIYTLIRTQIGLLVKANIKTLWPIATTSKLLSDNNLIGKDVYIVKNNDLVQYEGEGTNEWLDRMQFELGFGPTPSRKQLEDYGHGEDIVKSCEHLRLQ
jgi:hypothetical protein